MDSSDLLRVLTKSNKFSFYNPIKATVKCVSEAWLKSLRHFSRQKCYT